MRSRNNHIGRKHQSAFTLIELLVAITILAIIAVLGWRGLDSIVRARAGLTVEMEQTRGIQLAFAQIENDCAHLADASNLTGRETMSALGNRLVLIRTVFEENQPSRLQVVLYQVREGVLSRREALPTRELAALDKDWQNAINDADANPIIALQSQVAGFEMRTWRNGEGGWRSGGSESDGAGNPGQPGSAAGQAPKTAKMTGLEISVQLAGHELPVTKVFLLGAV
ncbi:PulJ/GspJ family protein [Undibacterium sp. TJN19]|uniref:PulJ/GspJ family protein n=1 Tax=Undibacterium sp. TJN19 TaxID=3413055 RepID=UPI003BEF7324